MRYIFLPTETGWVWSIHGDLAVEVVTSAPSSFQPFNASSRFTAIPEDPNLSYPAGHYLPFPLGLGEVHVDGSAVIQLLWR